MDILAIPAPVMEIVFGFLNWRELSAANAVCKALRAASSKNSLFRTAALTTFIKLKLTQGDHIELPGWKTLCLNFGLVPTQLSRHSDYHLIEEVSSLILTEIEQSLKKSRVILPPLR